MAVEADRQGPTGGVLLLGIGLGLGQGPLEHVLALGQGRDLGLGDGLALRVALPRLLEQLRLAPEPGLQVSDFSSAFSRDLVGPALFLGEPGRQARHVRGRPVLGRCQLPSHRFVLPGRLPLSLDGRLEALLRGLELLPQVRPLLVRGRLELQVRPKLLLHLAERRAVPVLECFVLLHEALLVGLPLEAVRGPIARQLSVSPGELARRPVEFLGVARDVHSGNLREQARELGVLRGKLGDPLIATASGVATVRHASGAFDGHWRRALPDSVRKEEGTGRFCRGHRGRG